LIRDVVLDNCWGSYLAHNPVWGGDGWCPYGNTERVATPIHRYGPDRWPVSIRFA